jgi:hypothetical protein
VATQDLAVVEFLVILVGQEFLERMAQMAQVVYRAILEFLATLVLAEAVLVAGRDFLAYLVSQVLGYLALADIAALVYLGTQDFLGLAELMAHKVQVVLAASLVGLELAVTLALTVQMVQAEFLATLVTLVLVLVGGQALAEFLDSLVVAYQGGLDLVADQDLVGQA